MRRGYEIRKGVSDQAELCSLTTRVPDRLRYLCPTGTDLSRFAVWLSERSKLLGSVVTSTMAPQQRAVKSDLHGVARKADGDGDAHVAVAHPITGSGEAHRAMLVDDAQDLPTLGGL